nr:uncharacterized protein LOC128697033 isoform X1 [Cherax quadricarinatus]
MDELRLVASAGNIDVFALTETWFNSKSRDMPAECHIQGFKLFQVDRSIGKGGGVALYVRDRLNCCIKTGIKSEVTHTESVWIEFSEGHEKLILGVIYRPPNLDRDQGRLLWEEIVKATRHDNVVILGDFNFSHIDWNFLTGNLESYDFLEVVQDCFLKQFVTEPTRGNNLLDLVMANNESLVNNLEISEELGASDHKSITFSIEWKYDSSDNSVTVPDFCLADYDGLREHLSSVDWGNEVSYQYDSFLNTMHAAQRTFIPYKEIRSNRNDPKWMNNRLKYLLGHKKGIYRRIKRGEGHLMNQYIDIKRDIKKGIRKAKRDYEIKVARDSKTNPKSFFQVYRTKVRDKIGPLKNTYGHLTDKDNEMCSIFNNYFLSVFTQEDTNNIPVINFYSGLEEDKLCNITVTSEMVVKQIDRLKQNKLPGRDEVFSRVLKECKMELCEPLTNIFNLSLQTGVVSDMWKMANVIPIFKTGTSRYRQITAQ